MATNEVPKAECDIIMKGGIASGVVYPGVVCELSKQFRLRSIGGASAGAIASAVAAAAEHGRASGGFAKLAALPAELNRPSPTRGSVLFQLFQPAAKTKALYKLFAAALGRSGVSRMLSVVLAMIRSFPLAVLLGAVLGAAVIVCGVLGSGVAAVGAIVSGILLIVVGVAVGAGFALSQLVARAVPANRFGVCSGMPTDNREGGPQALTPWLHAKIQDLAGLAAGDDPLTFGALAATGCDLRMMTTNLTLRRATRLPLSDQNYFFDPDDFRELFPKDVVDWMENEKYWPPLPEDVQKRAKAVGLVPMPAAAQLPVVVATRMSLSFPFLISAIPLYTVDGANIPDAPKPGFGVHWFSDGGICSNLPVHFFDRPLPTRPTFAIDLAPFPLGQKKSPDESENTYLPALDDAGRSPGWGRWPTAGFGGLTGFATAIFSSAQCWVDESEAAMAGYHDRIVTVYQDKDEGGMNLTMPTTTVDSLVARGGAAAGKLVDRFAIAEDGTPAAGWENQRWIRFRTATAGLSDWLAAFCDGYHTDAKPATPYSDLAGLGAAAPLPSYPIDPANRGVVDSCTNGLLDLGDTWSTTSNGAFTDGMPPQRPVLRLMPTEGFE